MRASSEGRSEDAQGKVSAEIEALQRQAQQLREGAAELEAAQEAERAVESERLFKNFDADGSGTIDIDEVIRGLKEFDGTEVDREQARKILEACDLNKNGVLEREEFDIMKLKGALLKLQAAERAAQEVQRRQEREQKQQEEKERIEEEFKERLATIQDTSLPVRLASILAYTLPLLECARFVVPAAISNDTLTAVLQPLVYLAELQLQIPFSGLFIFIAMQWWSANPELPLLLRYNLRQAIVLQIMLFVPNIFSLFLSAKDLIAAGAAIFAVFVLLLTYISIVNLLGMTPNNIPLVSGFTDSSFAGGPLITPDEDETKKK